MTVAECVATCKQKYDKIGSFEICPDIVRDINISKNYTTSFGSTVSVPKKIADHEVKKYFREGGDIFIVYDTKGDPVTF